MFSDSHCHLLHISQRLPHFPLMLKILEHESYRFIMDIGTEAGDFHKRFKTIADAWGTPQCPAFVHFSAGLWPGKAVIENSESALAALDADIQAILKSGEQYTAVGECGIDRHWNRYDSTASGAQYLADEEQLFKRQLEIAAHYGLAVIIHSRDGFEPTLRCIDEVGWHKGVIHCFSYGEAEAEAFLKRGWYLSFPGTITYPANAAKAAEVMQMVPSDKLLLETDAPYLSPTPVRGETNTPLFIGHTYEYASNYRKQSVQELCEIVYRNCCRLFAVP